MIKVEYAHVMGFKGALRGMRNPKNSWSLSDSSFTVEEDKFVIGANDMRLAKILVLGGTEHRKFLRFAHIQMDVTAPLFWWKQLDTYKFIQQNSCSTMHKLTSRHLNKEDFSCDMIDDEWMNQYLHIMNGKIDIIHNLKERGLDGWKEHERSLFCMLLESYNQKRTIDLNYETALNILKQRRSHKLAEWNEFCDELLKLPYMEVFYGSK